MHKNPGDTFAYCLLPHNRYPIVLGVCSTFEAAVDRLTSSGIDRQGLRLCIIRFMLDGNPSDTDAYILLDRGTDNEDFEVVEFPYYPKTGQVS